MKNLRLRNSCARAGTKRGHGPGWRSPRLLLCALVLLLASPSVPGCSTSSGRSDPKKKEPEGFWSKLMDQMTERECLVGGFSCPYGLGPAGERCECTDPSGRVLYGRTIK